MVGVGTRFTKLLGRWLQSRSAQLLPCKLGPARLRGGVIDLEAVVFDAPGEHHAVTVARLADRRTLMQAFDNMRRDIDQRGEFEGLDKFGAQALEMITSDKVRDAFDLSKEPDRVKELYGMKPGALRRDYPAARAAGRR